MGQVVNAANLQQVRYPIICGSANNQLESDEYAEILKDAGVMYCPDWLVSAGGVIAAACEVGQVYDPIKAESMTDYLGVRLLEVLTTAKAENKTSLAVAMKIAENRFTR